MRHGSLRWCHLGTYIHYTSRCLNGRVFATGRQGRREREREKSQPSRPRLGSLHGAGDKRGGHDRALMRGGGRPALPITLLGSKQQVHSEKSPVVTPGWLVLCHTHELCSRLGPDTRKPPLQPGKRCMSAKFLEDQNCALVGSAVLPFIRSFVRLSVGRAFPFPRARGRAGACLQADAEQIHTKPSSHVKGGVHTEEARRRRMNT